MIKYNFSTFNVQQDLVNRELISEKNQPKSITDADDKSSSMGFMAEIEEIGSRKKLAGNFAVIQQKFPERKEYKFLRPKAGKLVFQGANKHFYPMPAKNIESNQRKIATTVSFTPEGLQNLRKRYDAVHGPTKYLHAFLKMESYSENLQDMVKNPALYRYFQEENFLIISNVSYDPVSERHVKPKAQKLKDQGITIFAWFIHPNLDSINDDTRTLLRELSEEKSAPKPFIEKLRVRCQSAVVDKSKEIEKDKKTIGQLKQKSEYLASILDLDASHVPMLKKLKEKAMNHLFDTYGVNEKDQVALYFHFPYSEGNMTLHLHIRANQGMHPFEEGESFALDQIILDLSSGKNIDEIILDKQRKNGGRLYRLVSDHEQIYDSLEGVTIKRSDENIYRVDPKNGDINTTSSRDDLFDIEK